MKRSRLLTHWTGCDICTARDQLTPNARLQYMERLFSLLDDGLWMTVPAEPLVGLGDAKCPRQLAYQVPMTCFTELRLSAAQAHDRRYGLVGIVLDRTFVLHRWGAPVHYVRSTADDPVVGNTVMLLEWLQQQVNRNVEHAETVMTNTKFLVGFMKNMSQPDAEDFLYMDEQEWRIVHSHSQQERGRIVETGKKSSRYVMPFTRIDVQMIVAPDANFRTELCASERFRAWVGDAVLPVLTSEEIEHF